MNAHDFENLYREHAKRLFRICMVFVKDEATAADMVQDIFCSLWERKDTLIIEGEWEHFFYRSAKYKYYNHYRKQKTTANHLEAVALESPKYENTTEQAIQLKQASEQLEKLIEAMPEKRRQVFRLSREEGLSNKEIALRMGISEKTVKNHMTKSLSYLRTHMGKLGVFISLYISI
ncbi:MAG: RNA polymerase sigma-70 factor [Bacteroidota bacterium]